MLAIASKRPSSSAHEPAPAPDPTGDPAANPTASRAPVAWAGLALVVAGKSLLNLLAAGRYGWHRDELYYLAAGRHLDLGFVDFPPVTAVLARLSEALWGTSLIGLRSFAIAAGAAVVVLTALIARELGGGRWAQLVAALSVCGLTLGSNAMFQTVSFDQLAWAATFWAALRVLRSGGRRRWLMLGAIVGLGVETKYTVIVLVAMLGIGFIATPIGRARLREPGARLGAGLALALALPNLWWQVRHGWPSVDFFSGRNGEVRADYPPLLYVAELLLVTGPPALVVWWTGARSLLRDARLRAIGIAVVSVPVAFLVLGGKGYYAAPAAIAAFAAGSVAMERTQSPRRRRVLPAVLAAGPLVFSPVILPVLPESTMVAAGLAEAREDYAEELGWIELVDAVAAAHRALPADERERTAVLSGNYGEAGAIDLYGPGRGLPDAVSGHLTYRYWTPSDETLAAKTLLVVGYDRSWLESRCATLDQVGTVENRAGVDNEEAGGAVLLCRLPGSLAELWPSIAAGAD